MVRSVVLAVLLIASLVPCAAAQAIIPSIGAAAPLRRVWLNAGYDPSWMLGLGYSQRVPRRAMAGARIDVDAALRLPLLLGLDSFQLAAGTTAMWLSSLGLGGTIGLHPDLRLAHDPTGTKLALGAALTVRPGYYTKQWSAAIDLVWSAAFATRMWHSSRVRDLFADRHPNGVRARGPHDGWFRFPAQRLRVGAALGYAPAQIVALHLSGGFAYTPQQGGLLINPPYGPLPFYIDFGGAWRW